MVYVVCTFLATLQLRGFCVTGSGMTMGRKVEGLFAREFSDCAPTTSAACLRKVATMGILRAHSPQLYFYKARLAALQRAFERRPWKKILVTIRHRRWSGLAYDNPG